MNLPGLETVGFQGQQGPDWLGAAAMLGGAALGGPIGAGIAGSMFPAAAMTAGAGGVAGVASSPQLARWMSLGY